ncbi:hypothetical protein BV25DRAFT_1990742 [Artomyces pyxidatus]|uniref:Uncharacterized protein n=1 Tax=Artomyces pyxidatus TaxID=48021 RepID=A0ACB8T5E3_9AGAM|nr:hypothetical protein BV25DRAFT_1990742 [Artomyces pyxidatus]
MSSTAAATDNSLLVTVKLLHVFGGIYIWEWVMTLGFEWDVYTGKRPWRWSFIVYLVCRTLALGGIICSFIGFNLNTEYNCTVWLRFLLVFSYFAIASSSLLILLRGVAIWGRSWYIICFTAGVWLTNIGFALFSVQQGVARWIPEAQSCAVTGTHNYRYGITANLTSDLTLLFTMFAGVLNKRNATGLWRVLYIQGLSWILVASFSEIPPVVLTFLNISDGWNLMFQVPHLVIIVIVATRVYRDLFQYISPVSTHSSRMPHPLSRQPRHPDVQVTIHKTIEVDVELSARSGMHNSMGEHEIDEPDHIVSLGEREAKQMYFNL